MQIIRRRVAEATPSEIEAGSFQPQNAFVLKTVPDCRIYHPERMFGIADHDGRVHESESWAEIGCSGFTVFCGGRFRPFCSQNGSPDHAGCHLYPRYASPSCIGGRRCRQLESHRLTPFQSFGLAEPIARALAEEKHLVPTPIQTQTVPLALAGRDIIGI